MQSPNHEKCIEGQVLSKGPGYKTIYKTSCKKVEISQNSLRIVRKDKEGKRHEKLYIRVLDAEKKRKIRFKSENWHLYSGKRSDDYWILEQKNAAHKSTGIIRIIEKSKAYKRWNISYGDEIIALSEGDWIYYTQRKVAIWD